MTENWAIRGEYMESCNCEVLCPCLLGSRDERGSALAEPTEGHCDVPMIFQIHDGHYGDVQLGGIKVGVAIYTPGPMGLGDWTFGLYLDEQGTPEQREASEKIFSGRSGGAVGRFFGPLIGHRLPDRIVSMEIGRQGKPRLGPNTRNSRRRIRGDRRMGWFRLVAGQLAPLRLSAPVQRPLNAVELP